MANLASGTAVTIAGMATGLHYEVLLAGFAGALVSLSFIGVMSVWRRLWSLFTSTIFAGYTAPVFALYVVHVTPGDTIHQGLIVFSGLVMGMGAQVLIPIAMNWLQQKASSYQG